MRLKRSSYFLIFLLLLGFYGVIKSLSFRQFEAMAIPLMMSSIILVLVAVELWRELRKKDKILDDTELKPKKEEVSIGVRQCATALGWLAGFSLGIYLLGFLIAIPLFVLCYLKRQGQGWLTAIVFAVVGLAFIYGLFELALKTQLYPGLIFSWQASRG